jgi:putative phage-type endonuclease
MIDRPGLLSIKPAGYPTPADWESAWHAVRARVVTSTDCAALFGLSPYATAFELWHIKAGNFLPEFEENERTGWGKALQDAIAHKLADDNRWLVYPFDQFMYSDAERIGSSFDFRGMFTSPTDAPAVHFILEIKNVDSLAFKRGWQETDFGLEAPAHIELQVQHQMEVSGIDLAYIGALVGGNTVKLLRRERDRAVGRAIRAKVAEFWASIDAGTPPPPLMPIDAQIVCALHGYSDGSVINADKETAELMAQYDARRAEAKAAETASEVLKAQILERVGPAAKVLADGYTLSATQVKETPPTVITEAMVGKTYGGRKGYRLFRVTHKEAAE